MRPQLALCPGFEDGQCLCLDGGYIARRELQGRHVLFDEGFLILRGVMYRELDRVVACALERRGNAERDLEGSHD